MLTEDELRGLDYPDLTALRDRVDAEVQRRAVIDNAPAVLNDLNHRVLTAEGATDGAPWRQPVGAHDAYPNGWTVTHNGKTWESLVAGNVWEPGVSGWREAVEEGGAPPEWVQPTGGHDAYSIGDLVTFEGAVYRSVIDGNVWSPAAHPTGWERID